MPLTLNTILQGRYRIIRQLGQGGMGTVYEAIDARLNSLVAIKECLNENDEGWKAFEREANLLANLRHPSLPKVTDHFVEGNKQFLVMEFIQGADLAKLLALRGRAFPPEEVLRWGQIVLNALVYLHRRNPPILHRDIKPSNLKIDEDGELFLLDFGLAKGAAGQMPTLVTSRSVRGYTPVYSPIEQIFGKGTDVRSDLYALGATLYHLMTNVVPIDGPTRYMAIEEDQPDPLQPADEVNPEVPHSVAAVLSQAMSINRKHRPASAAEMGLALGVASRALSPGEESEQKPADSVSVIEGQTSETPEGSEQPGLNSAPAMKLSSPQTESGAQEESQNEQPVRGILSEVGAGGEGVNQHGESPPKPKRNRGVIAVVGLCVVLSAAALGLLRNQMSHSQRAQQPPPETAPSNEPSPEPTAPPDEQRGESAEAFESNSPSGESKNSNGGGESNSNTQAKPSINRRVAKPSPTMSPTAIKRAWNKFKRKLPF